MSEDVIVNLGYWVIPTALVAVALVAGAKIALANDRSAITVGSVLSEFPIDATASLITFCLGLTFVSGDQVGASILICFIALLFCGFQIALHHACFLPNRMRWKDTAIFIKLALSIFASYVMMTFVIVANVFMMGVVLYAPA